MELDIEKLKELKIQYLKPNNMIESSEFEELRLKNEILIFDVRSEGEFEEFHVVNSINLPLLDNNARKVVGTIYKKQNQEKAIDAGWEFFKKTAKPLIDKAEKIINLPENKNKKIVIYCARGGMRSGIIYNILDLLKYDVYKLEGGLKIYKNFLNDSLTNLIDNFNSKLIVLEGQTGTQKTKIIEQIDYPKIDLEDLAQHRSSTYGSVNLNSRSQKMFTFLLHEELLKLKDKPFIIIEGESKRIGDVFVPAKFHKYMENGILVLVDATIKTRIKNIIESYIISKKSVDQIIMLTTRLTKYIGKTKVEWLIDLFKKEQFEEAVKYLLIDYYDKVYKKINPSIEYSLKLNSDSIPDAVNNLNEFLKRLETKLICKVKS